MADDKEAGVGLAGWLLASTLMRELTSMGVIAPERAQYLVDSALLVVERTHGMVDADVMLTSARARLEGLLRTLPSSNPAASAAER